MPGNDHVVGEHLGAHKKHVERIGHVCVKVGVANFMEIQIGKGSHDRYDGTVTKARNAIRRQEGCLVVNIRISLLRLSGKIGI